MNNINLKYITIFGFIALFVIGFGAGFAINGNNGQNQPYQLTLVITTNNTYNSSIGTQPAYFVLNGGQLQSSAVINVPANRLISLTIINYDDGADNVSSQFLNVNGTQNNQMTVVSNDFMNATESSTGINLVGVQTVSSLPWNEVSHTFTIGLLHVNIPIAPSSTVHTFITFTKTGTFGWQCFAPCGAGESGWTGTMASVGWMSGSVVVS